MFIKKLKDLGFDFGKVVKPEIKSAIEILSESTYGTFDVSESQKLGALDNSIFDSILVLHFDDPIVKMVSQERDSENAEIYNNGWNTPDIEEPYEVGPEILKIDTNVLTLPTKAEKNMDKEISEDKYYDKLGQVPPIYITTINGDILKGSFALGEPFTQIDTPNGLKDVYSAFYHDGSKYFEVAGVYFTEPGVANRMETLKWNPSSTETETEISRYTLKSNKQIKLIKRNSGYQVIVLNILTGPVLEYPKTTNPVVAAKNYIEAIGKYGESKVLSKGAFISWIEKEEMNIDALHEYAEEQGVTMDIENFAKGGKAKEKKVSSYPKKGHILDKFVSGSEESPKKEEPEPDRETKVFINTDVFTTGGDYILGGFDTKDLDNIEVTGDSAVLSIVKVKILFRSRIEKAVERFKNEVEENFRERVGYKSPTDEEVQNEFDGEIKNLLETYLSLRPSEITDTSVEAITDLIMENQSSQAWLNTIGDRISKFTSAVMYNGVTVNKIDQSKVTIDDAEDHTRFASLEQIMEQLHSITEKS